MEKKDNKDEKDDYYICFFFENEKKDMDTIRKRKINCTRQQKGMCKFLIFGNCYQLLLGCNMYNIGARVFLFRRDGWRHDRQIGGGELSGMIRGCEFNAWSGQKNFNVYNYDSSLIGEQKLQQVVFPCGPPPQY